MAINLTGSTIATTYSQLLHLDGGPTATPKVVYSGVGTATVMKLGTISVEFNNIKLDGNTISSTDTNGNLNFTPNGTGSVVISKVTFSDATQARTALALGSMATQNSNAVAITGGSIDNVTFTGSFLGITLIESDKFTTKNGGDGVSLEGSDIFVEGSSSNISLDISAKGTGTVNIFNKFGYGTGTGGTVTQLTSKATAVTLNTLSGQITMNAATLNRNTGVSFTLNNTFITATDVLIVNIVSGATINSYTATIDAIAAGSCSIHLHNHTTGTDLSEAVVLNFIVIKGVTS